MHILHITFMFPTTAKPLEGVAIENIVLGIKRAMPESKHTVLQLEREAPEDLNGTEKGGYKYYNIHLPASYKLYQFYLSGKIDRLLEEGKFDLIHFHNVFPGLLLLGDYIKEHKTPYIITFRGSCARALKYMYRRKDVNEIIQNALAYTFLSGYYFQSISATLAKQGVQLANEKTHFIPNFKNETWAEKVTDKLIENPIKIITLANIEKRKNLLNTLLAVHLLKGKYDIEYNIYGHIYEADEFNAIQPLLGGKIKYCPPMPNGDIKATIDNSHIMLLASRAETFGMAYMESILHRRPIVYGKNAGIATFIEDISCGVPVEDVNNPQSISGAIERCINNYNEYNFSGSEKFLEPQVIKQWLELYKPV